MTASIAVTNTFALVDDEDFEQLNRWHWHIRKGWNTIYAAGWVSGKRIEMHRVIMNPPKGMQVDHIDGNGMNNCKSNLRICTRRENHQNRKCHREGHLVGVSKHGADWKAQINIGKTVHLGTFDTPEKASYIYQLASWLYEGGQHARSK